MTLTTQEGVHVLLPGGMVILRPVKRGPYWFTDKQPHCLQSMFTQGPRGNTHGIVMAV